MYVHARTTAALMIVGGLVAGTAFAQAPPNPTQQLSTSSQDQVPVFRITVVGRTTPAINYRPRKGATKIDFGGTALLPQARGHATVEGKKGYMEIDAKFEKLQTAPHFGSEYLTYVLWAITPEGRAKNLGELQVNGDDGKLHVTTDLQAFGLIVTAEPYFAVTQPSDVVVIENVVRPGTVGNIEAVQAKYELLKRGSYLMNQDATRLKVKTLEPGAPLDLAEARNAVALARFASADRDAIDTFNKASRLLDDAELARERKRGANAIMMPARQAVQTAEDARLIAMQKQEEAQVAEERARGLQREAAALELARAEEARRRQAELQTLTADAGRLSAERATAEAERAKADALRAKADADRAKSDADREREAAESARAAADSARLAAEAQAQQAQTAAQQAQQAANQAEREKAELRERLMTQLNLILETRETARGLIVNLSDVLFDTGSAMLKPGAREKLAKVAGIILAYPTLRIEVDGHTDNVGSDSYNQRLSEQRAESVGTYLTRQGIAPNAVATSGFGKSQPVVSNDTAAGRQQNRRVELIVSGDAIGRR